MRSPVRHLLALVTAFKQAAIDHEPPPDEEWRGVVDGMYEVSNHGNVRRNGRILRPRLTGRTGNAYYTVCTSIGGKKRGIRVHRLVAEAFLGPCPYGHEVNHKDLNKFNNRVENLEYVTRSENVRHALSKLGPWQRQPNRPRIYKEQCVNY